MTISKNENYGSFEITFDAKPDAQTRELLKKNGYRWNPARGIWYGYAKIADQLNKSQEQATEQTPELKATKTARLTLWERTRTDCLPEYGTENAEKNAVRETARVKGWAYDRAVADYIRKHLRARFPEVKFSVRSGNAGYLQACDIYILSSPYARDLVKGDPHASDWRIRFDYYQNSPELEAILNYCIKLHAAFDADDGDHYADYGAHHDLYGTAQIDDYEYEQTQQTDADRAEVEAFRKAKAEAEAKERAEFLKKCEEEEKRREIERQEWEEREKRESKRAAEIAEKIKIEDLTESEEIAFLVGGIGKEANRRELDEMIGEVHANRTDAIISRRVTFDSAEDLGFFENHFLRDWDFLVGKGGTSKEGDKIVDCVAIYRGNVLKYVIDPEGFSYARYVYIPTDRLTEGLPADGGKPCRV